jgi:hypothetical protein
MLTSFSFSYSAMIQHPALHSPQMPRRSVLVGEEVIVRSLVDRLGQPVTPR